MLETHELLDRFEMLYPTNQDLPDLRRTYIDHDLSSLLKLVSADEDLRKAIIEKNLHSIFRLIPKELEVSGSVEDLRKAIIEKNLHSIFRLIPKELGVRDLRKAVTEENLHSIFRLINDDDLRKLVIENNIWKLWPILERYVSSQFITAFKNFFVNGTEIEKDCFSRGQLASKLWLVQELKNLKVELGTVFLCAGWYATLATMLFESGIKVNKIRSFDIDPSCTDIAETFNKPWFVDGWKFKSITKNIMDINYNEYTWQCWSNANNRISNSITDYPDTIINTSCEHINNFATWYSKLPKNKLIVLQTNNYFDIPDHCNCVNSLQEFKEQTPMSKVLFQGEIVLNKYTRYMRIGYI